MHFMAYSKRSDLLNLPVVPLSYLENKRSEYYSFLKKERSLQCKFSCVHYWTFISELMSCRQARLSPHVLHYAHSCKRTISLVFRYPPPLSVKMLIAIIKNNRFKSSPFKAKVIKAPNSISITTMLIEDKQL